MVVLCVLQKKDGQLLILLSFFNDLTISYRKYILYQGVIYRRFSNLSME